MLTCNRDSLQALQNTGLVFGENSFHLLVVNCFETILQKYKTFNRTIFRFIESGNMLPASHVNNEKCLNILKILIKNKYIIYGLYARNNAIQKNYFK